MMKRLLCSVLTVCVAPFPSLTAHAQTPPLSYAISIPFPVVSTEMPVAVRVTETNQSTQVVRIFRPADEAPVVFDYDIVVRDSSGSEAPLTPWESVRRESGISERSPIIKLPLNPGESDTQDLVVNYAYVLSPGIYTIELQQTGVMSITGNPTVTVEVRNASRGDLNADGVVDLTDLAVIQSALNNVAYYGITDGRDLNGDGKIDTLDARILTTLCTNPRCAAP